MIITYEDWSNFEKTKIYKDLCKLSKDFFRNNNDASARFYDWCLAKFVFSSQLTFYSRMIDLSRQGNCTQGECQAARFALTKIYVKDKIAARGMLDLCQKMTYHKDFLVWRGIRDTRFAQSREESSERLAILLSLQAATDEINRIKDPRDSVLDYVMKHRGDADNEVVKDFIRAYGADNSFESTDLSVLRGGAGEEVTLKGFTSTTIFQKIAEMYMRSSEEGGFLMEITIPAGTPFFFIDWLRYPDAVESNGNQYEVVLMPCTKIVTTSSSGRIHRAKVLSVPTHESLSHEQIREYNYFINSQSVEDAIDRQMMSCH